MKTASSLALLIALQALASSALVQAQTNKAPEEKAPVAKVAPVKKKTPAELAKEKQEAEELKKSLAGDPTSSEKEKESEELSPKQKETIANAAMKDAGDKAEKSVLSDEEKKEEKAKECLVYRRTKQKLEKKIAQVNEIQNYLTKAEADLKHAFHHQKTNLSVYIPLGFFSSIGMYNYTKVVFINTSGAFLDNKAFWSKNLISSAIFTTLLGVAIGELYVSSTEFYDAKKAVSDLKEKQKLELANLHNLEVETETRLVNNLCDETK